jgi:hypothetical protein
MTINSAIMLELARQGQVDVAHGAGSRRRPAPARHRSSHRRPVVRTRIAAVAVVVGGTLIWAVCVIGLAALAPQPAKAASVTALSATAVDAQPAFVRLRQAHRPEKWY